VISRGIRDLAEDIPLERDAVGQRALELEAQVLGLLFGVRVALDPRVDVEREAVARRAHAAPDLRAAGREAAGVLLALVFHVLVGGEAVGVDERPARALGTEFVALVAVVEFLVDLDRPLAAGVDGLVRCGCARSR